MYVVPKLLFANQTTFTTIRDIADNICLAKEMMMRFNQKSIARYACVAIDIQKAFDSINWEALKITLEGFGFGTSIINMLMECAITINNIKKAGKVGAPILEP